MKVCSKCNNELTVDDFDWDKTFKRFKSYCKTCRNKYYYLNKKQCRQSNRRYLLAKAGMTPDLFNTLNIIQEGKCAICGNPPGGRWNVLCADHDHKTKKPRGLLCNRCNMVIGHINDNPELLGKLSNYLKHPTISSESVNYRW